MASCDFKTNRENNQIELYLINIDDVTLLNCNLFLFFLYPITTSWLGLSCTSGTMSLLLFVGSEESSNGIFHVECWDIENYHLR